MSKDEEMRVLEELSRCVASGVLGGKMSQPPPGILLVSPGLSGRGPLAESLRSANERIEELEAKLENSIQISPGNAKLIIQFLPKPADGADWEVDATIDLLWKELERQAAKA